MTKKILTCALAVMFLIDVRLATGFTPNGLVASQTQTRKKRKTTSVSRSKKAAAAKRKELAALPTYIACGCGCCSVENPRVRCLYRSKGDDLQKIIDDDKRTASNQAQCALVGCAFPVKYVYCD